MQIHLSSQVELDFLKVLSRAGSLFVITVTHDDHTVLFFPNLYHNLNEKND